MSRWQGTLYYMLQSRELDTGLFCVTMLFCLLCLRAPPDMPFIALPMLFILILKKAPETMPSLCQFSGLCPSSSLFFFKLAAKNPTIFKTLESLCKDTLVWMFILQILHFWEWRWVINDMFLNFCLVPFSCSHLRVL